MALLTMPRSMWISHAVLCRVAALGVLLSISESSRAEEGGAGDYLPGLYSSLINITPSKPGFLAGSAFLFYSGSAGPGQMVARAGHDAPPQRRLGVGLRWCAVLIPIL
jgi:hypothetical protein